ncbi:DNA-directed RNA polymerase III subunit RPC5 [Oopsacas minuta]|uniref:DNA-directed RNA polymerase III subunit RPC5 n=1 Tax=Oopsacas minuta TaxID=111878 RepID=A0AAV7KHC9_9METZ|nr:DNA-directed RNA polymerase III subunit RPC5 [Oopsacas minuta]
MTSLDDPVVRSYEVFVSQALNDQLFVLQHPTRPAFLPFGSDQVLSVKNKPNQNRLQLEYKVTNSDNPARFCPIKSQLAKEQSDDVVDTRTPSYLLTSEPGVVTGDHYAVAVLKDNTLHLNPLEYVVQMRPDMSRTFGKNIPLKKQPETDEEMEGDIVPLQMRVARPSFNQERTNQRKRERQDQEEAWVPLGYNEFSSGTAGYLRSLLFGDVVEKSAGNRPISNEEYLEHLAQISRQVDRSLVTTTPVNSSLDREIRNKPIKDQLLHILRKVAGKCVKFSYVHALLGNQFSVENLLKGLQQISLLVQGWFVLMSSELYPLTGDNSSKVDPLELRRCRDFVLSHYALYKFLEKQNTFHLLGIPIEDFNEIFVPISSFYLRGKHSFKYLEDRNFIKEHLDICTQHSDKWKQIYETIRKHYKLDQPSETPSPSKVSLTVTNTSNKKRAKSDSGIDNNSVRQLLGKSPIIFQTLKNKISILYEKVKQENSEISNLFQNSEMFDQVLRTILQEINAAIIEIPASSVAKNRIIVVARETDSPSDSYRMALISCLEVKPVQKRQELIASFKKSVKSLPTNLDINEIILDLCDVTGSSCKIKGLDSEL